MPWPINPEDAAAKREFMEAFFDDALDRIAFLEQLVEIGRHREAMTLALTYVDSWGGFLTRPPRPVGVRFAHALAVFEEEAFFSLIHPMQVIREFARLSDIWKRRSEITRVAMPGPPYHLLSADEFLAAVFPGAPQGEIKQLRNELWRGTVASIAYGWLRNPSVHEFGSATAISFDETLGPKGRVDSIHLEKFLPVLRSMIAEGRRRSLETGELFGDEG